MTANSIAEALVCTAAGIFVAVPTLWCFNWRRDRPSVLDAEMEITSLELAKYLEKLGVRRRDPLSPASTRCKFNQRRATRHLSLLLVR